MYKAGDRVYYTSGIHGQSKNNPLFGSEYECDGTIISIDHDGGYVQVEWDNGTHNSYSTHDLTPILENLNPNMAFLHRKRYGDISF